MKLLLCTVKSVNGLEQIAS